MFRLVLCVCLIGSSILDAEEQLPQARKVTLVGKKLAMGTVAKAIKEQSAISVDVSAVAAQEVTLTLADVSFWKALEEVAQRTDSHIITTGARIALKPGRAKTVSDVNGPFRVAVREVVTRLDVQNGAAVYGVTYDVCWEPQCMVFRIDTLPTNTSGTTDAGSKLTFPTGSSRTLPFGSTVELSLRPEGVTRAAKSVSLAGTLNATIADELLSFSYDSTGKTIGAPMQKGVTARITKSGKDGEDWIVHVALQYPKDGPKWESFESTAWRIRNTIRLLPPNGEPILPDSTIDEETIQYVFKNHAKVVGLNWKIEYRTPGPMREVPISFALKDIPLP